MYQIEPHLYLSNITGARNQPLLQENVISTILTIDVQPLGDNDNERENIFVEMKDDCKTNLIERLPQCLDAIEDCVSKKRNILVHWYNFLNAFLFDNFSLGSEFTSNYMVGS